VDDHSPYADFPERFGCADFVDIPWESCGRFLRKPLPTVAGQPWPPVFPKQRSKIHRSPLRKRAVTTSAFAFSTDPQRSSQQQGFTFLFSERFL